MCSSATGFAPAASSASSRTRLRTLRRASDSTACLIADAPHGRRSRRARDRRPRRRAAFWNLGWRRLRLVRLCKSVASVARRSRAHSPAVAIQGPVAKPRMGPVASGISPVTGRSWRRPHLPARSAAHDGALYASRWGLRSVRCRSPVWRAGDMDDGPARATAGRCAACRRRRRAAGRKPHLSLPARAADERRAGHGVLDRRVGVGVGWWTS